ncbi:MAG: HGGxSTG domain-containing protein [Pseudomonadota bacterium]|nr:HGGxSTG domain-containing protein [Pseudomonadota bacterium]
MGIDLRRAASLHRDRLCGGALSEVQTGRGSACLKPALRGKNRCQLHGGKSTGAKGKRNGNYRHGRFTKEAIANRQAADTRVRELARLAREVGLFD